MQNFFVNITFLPNAVVYFDISAGGELLGRIEMTVSFLIFKIFHKFHKCEMIEPMFPIYSYAPMSFLKRLRISVFCALVKKREAVGLASHSIIKDLFSIV